MKSGNTGSQIGVEHGRAIAGVADSAGDDTLIVPDTWVPHTEQLSKGAPMGTVVVIKGMRMS